MTQPQYKLPNGKPVILGDLVGGGKGGEGAVHRIQGAPGLVAKIYHADKRPRDIGSKLQGMVKHPIPEPARSDVAWPLERIVKVQDRETWGYVMYEAPPDGVSAVVAATPTARRKNPQFAALSDQQVAVALAKAVSRYAQLVEGLHQAGYVVGDINEKNLLVWPNGNILALDADSFQTPGGRHRCRVGRNEYQPPEILRRLRSGEKCRVPGCPEGAPGHQMHLGCFDRERGHDRFALAVLSYQLLCNGRHPYQGWSTEATNAPARIPLGYFPFHEHGRRHIKPKPDQLQEWQSLSPELRDYFTRAFAYKADEPPPRPSAGSLARLAHAYAVAPAAKAGPAPQTPSPSKQRPPGRNGSGNNVPRPTPNRAGLYRFRGSNGHGPNGSGNNVPRPKTVVMRPVGDITVAPSPQTPSSPEPPPPTVAEATPPPAAAAAPSVRRPAKPRHGGGGVGAAFKQARRALDFLRDQTRR